MRPLKADKTPTCKKIIQMEQDGITEQNCILARIVNNKSCKSPDKVLHQFSQIIFAHFCGTLLVTSQAPLLENSWEKPD